MNGPAKLIALSCVSAVVGAVLATFALAMGFSTASRSLAADREDSAATPICSIASEASGSTFYSEMAAASHRMHEAMEIVPEGNIERDFIRMMTPHHQGAIDMALVLLKHGHDERLKRLAQSIVVEQGQEISYMRALLEAPSRTPSAPPPTNEETRP
jgi:uncharacterized protein (DUF305 family)